MAPSDGAVPPPPGRSWRRPAVLLAVALDVVVAVATVAAIAAGFSPIVIAFAVILGIAPWASIIDDHERPGRG